MTSTNLKEKRQFIRASFGWPTAIITGQGDTIYGRVRDISSGGALIHTTTKMKVDDTIELAMDIPDFKDILSATGAVVRVNVFNDDDSSAPTYALGIHFKKMSSKGLEYFNGNLPLGWRKPIISNRADSTLEGTSKKLQWVVGATVVAVLILTVLSFFQLTFQDPTISQGDLLSLSGNIRKELQSIREVSQQQATANIQTNKRLERIENSSISSSEIEEIFSLFASQAQDLQQIKNTLYNKSAINKVPTFHIVRHGETIFSISQQHGLEVEELLHYNALPKGTIIMTNQKLQLTGIFLGTK